MEYMKHNVEMFTMEKKEKQTKKRMGSEFHWKSMFFLYADRMG